jgi:hypothetical protein
MSAKRGMGGQAASCRKCNGEISALQLSPQRHGLPKRSRAAGEIGIRCNRKKSNMIGEKTEAMKEEKTERKRRSNERKAKRKSSISERGEIPSSYMKEEEKAGEENTKWPRRLSINVK